MGVIAVITDYGTQDYYVGALKGVMLQIAPDATIVDITHDIAPHNVAQAAFVLWQSWTWFPRETVFLAIVDPGVGTDRRIILGKCAGRYVVAPDNGLVTFVHQAMDVEALHVVENEQYFLPVRSATFHGRDMLAPVAAHIVLGADVEALGPSANQLNLLPVAARAEIRSDGVYGTVLYTDRFGTLVTNIAREQLAAMGGALEGVEVEVDGVSAGPIRSAFADVSPGAVVALIGGSGLLELAVNQGSAAERFGTIQVVRASRKAS